jgi:hypothetical protein
MAGRRRLSRCRCALLELTLVLGLGVDLHGDLEVEHEGLAARCTSIIGPSCRFVLVVVATVVDAVASGGTRCAMRAYCTHLIPAAAECEWYGE